MSPSLQHEVNFQQQYRHTAASSATSSSVATAATTPTTATATANVNVVTMNNQYNHNHYSQSLLDTIDRRHSNQTGRFTTGGTGIDKNIGRNSLIMNNQQLIGMPSTAIFPFKFDPVFIEDPLENSNNVARNCFRILQVQKCWVEAAEAITARLQEYEINYDILTVHTLNSNFISNNSNHGNNNNNNNTSNSNSNGSNNNSGNTNTNINTTNTNGNISANNSVSHATSSDTNTNTNYTKNSYNFKLLDVLVGNSSRP